MATVSAATVEKSKRIFSNIVVYKSAKRNKFFSALGIPSYLRDWIIMRFADDKGNVDIEKIQKYIKQYIPRREEAEAKRYAESRRLAECIQSYLVRNLGLEDDGVREASFVVVRTAAMPAVLVEVAYITNPREAGLLKQDSFLAKAAEAIYQGIVDYLASR